MQISETLSHIRLRPGFYLRTVIDGNKPNGGIYTMLREVLNNSINEFEAGNGCGTIVSFTPDATIFGDYEIKPQFIESIIRNCSYFETGLTFDFTYNNESEPELSYHKTIRNKNGLVDFIEYKLDGDESKYPPVHIKGEDFEVAFTHTRRFYRRQIFNQGLYSAVNGHFTIDGGEHLDAFTKSIAQAMSKRYGRDRKSVV